MQPELLIRCSRSEAEDIKRRAKSERRSVNAHVLNILDRMLSFEARVMGMPNIPRYSKTSNYIRPSGPRAVLFLRCTEDEAERIRKVAAFRQMPINEYVLTRLIRAYEIQDRLQSDIQRR